jgi:serine/threonine protein kinase
VDERWQEVERIFLAARELDKSAQVEFLAQACAGNEILRHQVESLLVNAEKAGSFLDSPAIEMAAESLAKDGTFSGVRNPELEPGTMIAHYRLTGKLGGGGMGVVYRARDTKLQRDVALKILPQALAHDAQRMARFEREAQVLASLNHPNIAAIHGLEEANGIRALVMELVEGETLGERISVAAVYDRRPSPTEKSGAHRAPLQIDDALPIAKQIAEAIEYAHERGVIHRDLKPANVKVTAEGTVKVLDFGLAKVLSPQDSSATTDPANSPTVTTLATRPGMLLGTAAYMSPEQAKGQPVDRRCDIWAFGCVLFEMFSGRKTFEGETISEVLAAVITKEPDWNALPKETPQPIQGLIRQCLEKDERRRLHSMGEARIAIEEAIAHVEAGRTPAPERAKEQPTQGRWRKSSRRRAPWWMYIVAASFLGFVAIYPYRVVVGTLHGAGFEGGFRSGAMVAFAPHPNSAEARAGLEEGDRVLAVNGADIHDVRDWEAVLANTEVGQQQRWEISRAGKRLELTVQVPKPTWADISPFLGLTMANNLFILISLVLGLLVAFRRPHDPVARMGAWGLVTAACAFGYPDGWAATWRHLPAVLSLFLWIPEISRFVPDAILLSFFLIFPRKVFRARWPWLVIWAPALALVPWRAKAVYEVIYKPWTDLTVPGWVFSATSFRSVVYVVASLLVLVLSYRKLTDAAPRARSVSGAVDQCAGSDWMGRTGLGAVPQLLAPHAGFFALLDVAGISGFVRIRHSAPPDVRPGRDGSPGTAIRHGAGCGAVPGAGAGDGPHRRPARPLGTAAHRGTEDTGLDLCCDRRRGCSGLHSPHSLDAIA